MTDKEEVIPVNPVHFDKMFDSLDKSIAKLEIIKQVIQIPKIDDILNNLALVRRELPTAYRQFIIECIFDQQSKQREMEYYFSDYFSVKVTVDVLENKKQPTPDKKSKWYDFFPKKSKY